MLAHGVLGMTGSRGLGLSDPLQIRQQVSGRARDNPPRFPGSWTSGLLLLLHKNIFSRRQPPDRGVWQRQPGLCQTWARGRSGDAHVHPSWVIATQSSGGRTGQTPMKGSCHFGTLLSPGKEVQALELVTPDFNLPPKSQNYFRIIPVGIFLYAIYF